MSEAKTKWPVASVVVDSDCDGDAAETDAPFNGAPSLVKTQPPRVPVVPALEATGTITARTRSNVKMKPRHDAYVMMICSSQREGTCAASGPSTCQAF